MHELAYMMFSAKEHRSKLSELIQNVINDFFESSIILKERFDNLHEF